MIRHTAMLALAAAMSAAPIQGQGVVTVSTAEAAETGERGCNWACTGYVQYIRTPLNAVRVLSFKFYVKARNLLTGDPAAIPDYFMGFAPVPNWDPVRGNYLDGNCECFYGSVGKYAWSTGPLDPWLSALGQVGEGWAESRGDYQLLPSGGYNLPVRSEPLVGGEWLALFVAFRTMPDVVTTGVHVGNSVEGWSNIDWGGASADQALNGTDFRFEAKFVTVPEPSTFAMVLTGLLMMFGAARRRGTT